MGMKKLNRNLWVVFENFSEVNIKQKIQFQITSVNHRYHKENILQSKYQVVSDKHLTRHQ